MFVTHKHLERVVLTAAVIGIAAVYFSIQFIDAEKISIEDATFEKLGDFVLVCGTIDNKSISTSNIVFMAISGKNNEKLKIVFFKDVASGLVMDTYSKGDSVCIEGSIDIHEQEIEVIGKSIRFN